MKTSRECSGISWCRGDRDEQGQGRQDDDSAEHGGCSPWGVAASTRAGCLGPGLTVRRTECPAQPSEGGGRPEREQKRRETEGWGSGQSSHVYSRFEAVDFLGDAVTILLAAGASRRRPAGRPGAH